MTAPPAATVSSASAAAFRFSGALAKAVERCWRRAGLPAEWQLTRETFETTLERSVAQRFSGATASNKQVEAYLEGLHARDLALARACSAGNPAAWEFFVNEHRQEMYRAARAIVGGGDAGEAAARELADSLYADLYGLRESAEGRKSLFDYFHGRSKLSTWLRAVLAQRHVDEIRRARKTESIEDEDGALSHEGQRQTAQRAKDSARPEADDPERDRQLAMLQAALVAQLKVLDPRDRLRLAYYYADQRTLAEIGKLLGEHEATVSRNLDRIRHDLRRAVETALRDEKKLSKEQVEACLEHACDEWPFDLVGPLRSK
jgi:RNA polymerase sigma factor (sigma-70 family)